MPRSRKRSKAKSKSRSVRSKVGIRPIVMKVNYQKNNNNGGLRKYSNKLVNRSRGCTEGTYKVKRCCDMLGRSNSNKKNTYCKGFNKAACCKVSSNSNSNNSLLELSFNPSSSNASTSSPLSVKSSNKKGLPFTANNLRNRMKTLQKTSRRRNMTSPRGNVINGVYVPRRPKYRSGSVASRRKSSSSNVSSKVNSTNIEARFAKLKYDTQGLKLLKSVRKSHEDCKKLKDQCNKVKATYKRIPPEFKKYCLE